MNEEKTFTLLEEGEKASPSAAMGDSKKK